jgi:hypothetical protein
MASLVLGSLVKGFPEGCALWNGPADFPRKNYRAGGIDRLLYNQVQEVRAEISEERQDKLDRSTSSGLQLLENL